MESAEPMHAPGGGAMFCSAHIAARVREDTDNPNRARVPNETEPTPEH